MDGSISAVEFKFEAALNVIKNLPKNGSYKPTPQMMLKFYSYYKQATEGPCNKPKPWAWDVINKAKWEAWSKLGNMSKEKAMEEYVENLKLVMTDTPPVSDEQIVEAMPATENVQTFIKILGNFYEAVDLEPPSQFKKFNGVPSSTPLVNGSAGLVSHQSAVSNGTESQSADNSDVSSVEDSDHGSDEDPQPKSEDSEDEFCDTAEDIRIPPSAMHSYTVVGSDGKTEEYDSSRARMLENLNEPGSSSQHVSNPANVPIHGFGGEHGARGPYKVTKTNKYKDKNQKSIEGQSSGDISSQGAHMQSVAGGGNNNPHRSQSEVHNQISETLAELRRDVNGVLNRLSVLEELAAQREAQSGIVTTRGSHRFSGVWPFTELSPRTVVFVLSWPLFVIFVLNAFRRRRLKR